MKDFIYKRLLTYLILFQPIIDIITSAMVLNGWKITIGVITKMFILLLAVIYLLFYDKEKRRFNIICLFVLSLFSFLNILNNVKYIELSFFEYFNSLFKYIYHLVILLFFVRWYQNYSIKLYQLRIPILIIVISYFLAMFTGSAYNSYYFNPNKVGLSGWYSSANELGNLLCLLFPIAIYNAFHNKDGIKLDILLCIMLGTMMLLLGTKVGLVGFFGVAIVYLLLQIGLLKKNKLGLGFVTIFMMLVLSLLLINKLPAVYNIKYVSDDSNDINYVLLSGRREYLRAILKEYDKSTGMEKIFGKTYYQKTDGQVEAMLVEQDFYDIFFMYGYIGVSFFLIAYFMVYLCFIQKFLGYYKKRKSFSKKYLAIIIAISLELCVAFISGHSLLSPSISTYLILLVALSFALEFNDESSNKKSILMSPNNNYYLKLDHKKYDVTLLMCDKKQIPDYRNLYPYYVKINYYKVLFNKITAYIMNRNQKYDIILLDDTNNSFENTYLKYAKGNEKIDVKDFFKINRIQ